jgi:hypothetical protein
MNEDERQWWEENDAGNIERKAGFVERSRSPLRGE